MLDIIEMIKKDTKESTDILFRNIDICGNTVCLVFSEVLISSEAINQFILKNISKISSIDKDLCNTIYNSITGNSIKKLTDYNELLQHIFLGYTVIIIDNNTFIAVETKASLDRGISETTSEVALIGPKDAFSENFNKNLGLMRKRIRSSKFTAEALSIGASSNTKVGICYMNDIADLDNVKRVRELLSNINIDAIIDSGYVMEKIQVEKNLFPTVNQTERPDLACFALLEGKIVIIIDNSPYVLIVPNFFTDLFHTPDDYYQKNINTTFTRILRLISFFIGIFLPGYYISLITYNSFLVPSNLMTNILMQHSLVHVPSFFEAFIMIICFEILRESDIRIPSKVGSSISILGGLILGDAAVNAGIVSPIMILVIAISSISSLIFTYNSMINLIRYYRFFVLVLAALFGIYGLFLGLAILIIKLSSTEILDISYTSPLSPLIKEDINDSFVKIDVKKGKFRNPLLAKKNIKRGE